MIVNRLRPTASVIRAVPAAIRRLNSNEKNCQTASHKSVTRQTSNLTGRLFHTSTFDRNGPRLAEVGKLEPPKTDGNNYSGGQMFLHRLFGYRGVILFPWSARVYDRDKFREKKDSPSSTPSAASSNTSTPQSPDNPMGYHPPSQAPPGASPSSNSGGKEVKGKMHTYYQVLIDSRDCPYITHKTQTESVTFLGNHSENARNLYAVPGLDYVAHEDIMPYSTSDKSPIQHELFDKFLQLRETEEPLPQAAGEGSTDSIESTIAEPQFVPQDTLRAWQEKNHPWLELSDVHKQTTENIRVTVIPFYMGYRENQGQNVYWWRYCIRLENLGEQTVQLRERNWKIFSLSGTLETVRGRGVVGQEPILSRMQPAFQYSSHVSLQAPSGHMWGTFRMERQDGLAFDCVIPPFSLESKYDDPTNGEPILGN